MNNTIDSTATVFANTYVKAFATQVTRINDFLANVSDEDLARETAPGRNTGIYLLGHLAASNDGILVLLGASGKLYPQLEKLFLTSPDHSGAAYPTVQELKKYWNDVNAKLQAHFATLTPEEWLTRHTAVSEEDFAKEPHRNKLSIIVSRTTHLSYHLGQLVYLKRK